MALPADVQSVLLTFGPVSDWTGMVIPNATVTIEASASLVHAASGTPFLAAPIRLQLDEAGTGSAILPATDQDGFLDGQGNSVKDWTYRVTWKFRDRNIPTPTPVDIALPASVPTVDFDTLISVPSSTGTTVAVDPSGAYATNFDSEVWS